MFDIPFSASGSGLFLSIRVLATPILVLMGQWENSSKRSNNTIDTIFQAFTAMMPLFEAPAHIGKLSNTLEPELRQSSGVLKQMCPSGTLNSEFTQVNEIYDSLSNIQRYYQANITTELNMVQSSFPTSTAFAS